MAKTGPQRYPGASTGYWYGSKYPGSAMESNVVVWHTTEGTSLPAYDGGSMAPNFTAVPDFKAKRLVWYQHFDFDSSSRALVNRAGGVETNTLNAVQVELVGTCDPTAHKRWGTKAHLYTADLPDWVIRDLGAFARWARDHHSVPLTSGQTFVAYPASYGATKTRMANAEWLAFKGHCGHQHVPENDHGDPGTFPIAAVLAAATGTTTTPTEEDPMAGYSKRDIAGATWDEDMVPAPEFAPDYAKNKFWKPSAYLRSIYNAVITIRDELRAVRTAVDALTKSIKES
ncbi:hypothetical protein ACFYPA_05960 [Streptomyces sp. NPDC005775]|uniref:hypothetical protein n=1 Tax=Streptomyces sp. NPDC005775 TaxID=3364729 RepID=UPI00368964D0